MVKYFTLSSHIFYMVDSSSESWTKVLGDFCVSGAISNAHRSNPLPSPHKQYLTRVSRIFSEFQLSIGWGEGELQENFEKDAPYVLRGNREMTEKYEYCNTVARTFVQDCSFMKSRTVYEASLRTFVRFEAMI